MAYTQDDVDALKAAIATGTKRARYSDGSEVEYRTLAEMRQALALIEEDVAAQAGAKSIRAFRGGYMKSGY